MLLPYATPASQGVQCQGERHFASLQVAGPHPSSYAYVVTVRGLTIKHNEKSSSRVLLATKTGVPHSRPLRRTWPTVQPRLWCPRGPPWQSGGHYKQQLLTPWQEDSRCCRYLPSAVNQPLNGAGLHQALPACPPAAAALQAANPRCTSLLASRPARGRQNSARRWFTGTCRLSP
jgi:hypothetical protein